MSKRLLAWRRAGRAILQMASVPYRPPETRKDYDPWDPDYGKQRARDRVMRKYWNDKEALTPGELKEVEDWVKNLPGLNSKSYKWTRRGDERRAKAAAKHKAAKTGRRSAYEQQQQERREQFEQDHPGQAGVNSQAGGPSRKGGVNPVNARIVRWAKASYTSSGKRKSSAKSASSASYASSAAAAPSGGGSPAGA